MLLHYTFQSNNPGANILILWSIHWNETCWSSAIEKLREYFINWKIKLINGSVKCVPYANHDAYLLQKRQTNINLNRIFQKKVDQDNAILDEILIAEQIKDLIGWSDFTLDLHSFPSWEDVPFLFKDIEDNTLNEIFAKMPIQYVVSWWNDLYDWSDDLDTIWYAKKLTKIGFCLECWLNWSIKSELVAFQTILCLLESFWSIKKNNSWSMEMSQIEIQIIDMVRKPKWWRFTREWKNFDPISNNTAIWIDEDWNNFFSKKDWYIVIPNAEVEEWWEWFYIWIKK